MDTVTAFRVGVTVLTFLVFIGIVWWAYGGRHNSRFRVAAHSVLQDDDLPSSPIVREKAK